MITQVLFQSASVSVTDVACPPGHQPRSEVETEASFGIGFPRQGVYVHETPDGRIVADPAVMLFRNRGDEQTTTHPTSDGDANTEIQFAAFVVDSLLDQRDRFRRRMAHVTDELALAHLRLLERVRSPMASTLGVEEEALGLLGRCLGLEPVSPTVRHREMVDDTRELLGGSYQTNVELGEIADRVGSSPFHLSRVFRECAGMSITSYRNTLRVRHVLGKLADGANDLTALAIDAGFYDHSHMTRTIRQRLGSTPSALRRLLSG